MHYMKSNFYSSFNSIFHRVAKFQNKLIVLHLVSAYCMPYLLYATGCLGLNVTQVRSIVHMAVCSIAYLSHNWC